LKDFVLGSTGLAYFADKDADFAARLARRIKALDLPSCSNYFALLRHPVEGPAEMERLVGELTIGETYFFRQIEHFDLLRTRILPEILQRKAESRTLSIWSAGSAIGAEAYSISILLKTEFAARLDGWRVSITATDLNVDFLAAAREGVYTKWALRSLPPHLLNTCFEHDGARSRIRPQFREDVYFSYHNLVDEAHFDSVPRSPFDIIMCRNVMIYFSQEQNRRLIQNFHNLLQPGGWLIVGHAEYGGQLFPDYETINAGNAVVFRRPCAQGLSTPAPAPLEITLPPVPLPVVLPEAPPAVQIQTARALADRGEWDAAEKLCRQRVAVDSLDCEAHFTLGLILEHRGLDAEAVTEMRSTIYLDRGFALAYYHLGMLLRRTGDVSGSRKAFRNLERILEGKEAAEAVDHGDGIQVQELLELGRMQQEALA
jgi:chemotaxis protein methyltransferase CheR